MVSLGVSFKRFQDKIKPRVALQHYSSACEGVKGVKGPTMGNKGLPRSCTHKSTVLVQEGCDTMLCKSMQMQQGKGMKEAACTQASTAEKGERECRMHVHATRR